MSDTMVKIVEEIIDIQQAFAFVAAPEQGASACFVGSIRDHNKGKKVLGVSYDVFVPLAEKILAQLCVDVRRQWGKTLRIYIVHFKGRLAVGETSVVIAVSSPHRNEAFLACRYLIEEIKHRCPIWKQEHYVDGHSEWVQGHALCAHD